jgi:hypothetical protein
VEKFGWNFFASPYSEPEGMELSSAAMVTATEKVQAEEKTSTTKGTKDHEGLHSFVASFV